MLAGSSVVAGTAFNAGVKPGVASAQRRSTAPVAASSLPARPVGAAGGAAGLVNITRHCRKRAAGLVTALALSLAQPAAAQGAACKDIGGRGWGGPGWPKEFGGQGRSIEEQFVFFDEVQRAGLPFPFVTVNTVGPTLMKYGTEEQKERFLPGILAGDIVKLEVSPYDLTRGRITFRYKDVKSASEIKA